MIFNKYLSILFSACLFMMLMFLTSSVVAVFFKGGAIPFIGLFFVVVYYFIARAFYSYLRNDDHYKNTRKHSSDKEGESYITKGEKGYEKTLHRNLGFSNHASGSDFTCALFN